MSFRNRIGILLAVSLGLGLLTLSACEDALTGPRVSQFRLVPNTVSPSGECGMTDQYFEAEAVISGGDSLLSSGQLALLETPNGDRPASPESIDIINEPDAGDLELIEGYTPTSEDAVLRFRIRQDWCGGLDTGSYPVQVTAVFENGTEINRTYFGALTVTN